MNSFVARISVTDSDEGRNAQVSCSTLDVHVFRLSPVQERFSSSETEYNLVTAYRFDREMKSTETVRITCQDGGEPRLYSNRTILVRILDENDNYPVPEKDSWIVEWRENNLGYEELETIRAFDPDEGLNGKLSYALVSNSTGSRHLNNVVAIDDSGVLRATGVFDFEQVERYSFQVVISDLGDPPRSSTVDVDLFIVDVNDERPIFDASRYEFSIAEPIPAMHLIGVVRAVDHDKSPEFNTVRYSLAEPSSLITVHAITGEIRNMIQLSQHALDGAAGSTVTVVARDGQAGFESTTNVTILFDLDDSPIINFPNAINYTLVVEDKFELGSFIGRIDATCRTPSDQISRDCLTYELVGGDYNGYFSIDPTSGWLRINSDVSIGEFQVEVAVRSSTNPKKVSKAKMIVVLKLTTDFDVVSYGASIIDGNYTIFAIVMAGGALVLIMMTVALITCFRVCRRKAVKTHSYNCRLESDRAVSNLSLNRQSNNRRSFNDGFCGIKSSGRSKKGVTFSREENEALSISLPITTSKISCPVILKIFIKFRTNLIVKHHVNHFDDDHQ